MIISSEAHNCFKVREVTDNGGEFSKMIQGMRERGVPVRVLADNPNDKRFSIN